MDIPSFWCIICLCCWIRSYLSPKKYWWQYISDLYHLSLIFITPGGSQFWPKKNIYIAQFFSADATLYHYVIFFCPWKVEKTTLKVAKKYSTKFSLLPWAAQTDQTEELMFQNVAYRPTIYKTGGIPVTPFFPWKLS